jgi:serine/threonine protein kinase
MDHLKCEAIMGSGTYGKVYSAKTTSTTSHRDVKPETLAVKRNFVEDSVTGFGSARELDFLVDLRGHPCITDLNAISIGNPFGKKPMSPVGRKNIGDDKIHFVMELVDTDGYKYVDKNRPTNDQLIKIINAMWRKVHWLSRLNDERVTVFKNKLKLYAKEVPYDIESAPLHAATMMDIEKNLKWLEDKLYDLSDEMKSLKKARLEYFHNIKIIICQLFIGLEYCHAKNIIHRDIKPGNLLIVNKEIPQLKICDFGLSRRECSTAPSTPRGVTSWYRAPEICVHDPNYGKPADIWAAALTAYEFVSGHPMLTVSADEDEIIFNCILGGMEKLDPLHVDTVRSKGRIRIPATTKATPAKRKTFEESIDLSYEEVEAFNEAAGSYTDFIDFLRKLIIVDPNQRLTATQALQHPFLSYFKSYIDGMRLEYPPVPNALTKFKIIKCQERRWSADIMARLYNDDLEYMKKRHTDSEDYYHWYRHIIIFHSIRLFDQYLEWAYSDKSKYKIGTVETATKGKLHTKEDTEFIVYSCVYIIHKFYSTLQTPLAWTYIFPSRIVKTRSIKQFEIFEDLVLRNIVDYRCYSPGILEMIDANGMTSTDELIRKLLVKYLDDYSFEGTIAELFTKLNA